MFIRRTFNQLGFLNSGINKAILLFFAVIVLMNTFDNNAGAQYDPCTMNPGSPQCHCYEAPQGSDCTNYCTKAPNGRLQAECRDNCSLYPDSPGCLEYCNLAPNSGTCKCRNPTSKSCGEYCMRNPNDAQCNNNCKIYPSNCICADSRSLDCFEFCSSFDSNQHNPNRGSPKCLNYCRYNPEDCDCNDPYLARSNPNCRELGYGEGPKPDPEPEPTAGKYPGSR